MPMAMSSCMRIRITDSMKKAIDETKRRRSIQEAYNQRTWYYTKNDSEEIPELIRATQAAEEEEKYITKVTKGKKLT